MCSLLMFIERFQIGDLKYLKEVLKEKQQAAISFSVMIFKQPNPGTALSSAQCNTEPLL